MLNNRVWIAVLLLTIASTSIATMLREVPKIDYTRQFLELCSNVTIHDDYTRSFAHATCSSYARGLAEGQTIFHPTGNPLWWCLQHGTTSEQLMDSILVWIHNNESTTQHVFGQYSGGRISTVIILKALIGSYPCS